MLELKEEEEKNAKRKKDHDSDAFCIFCCEKFSTSKAKEKWIRCCEYKQWAYVDFAGISTRINTYICDVYNEAK